MSIRTANDAQAEAALDLIVACQADPARTCPYVGTEHAGILAELTELQPGWRETLRIGVRDGAVVAAACGDYDEETHRSWIQGPWAADDAAWTSYADALVDAIIAQAPAGVEDHELCGTPRHTALADLAARRGWRTGAVSIAYVARSADDWPEPGPSVRGATMADLAAVAELHDLAFPGTYATARSLLADEDRITLVLDGPDGSPAGYAAAQVQPDGAGYLDFIAIAPGARGRGLSKLLLSAIGRRVLAAAPNGDVNLTVVETNTPAVALYESFGFVRDIELVGYRSRP